VKFFFITTFIPDGDRRPLFERMIRSVAGALAGRDDIGLSVYALIQRCSTSALDELRRTLPPIVSLSTMDGTTSLSQARNELLNRLYLADKVEDDDIVAFPDDDCWYPDGLPAFVANEFRTNGALDFWFCRYSSAPRGVSEAPATSRAQVRNVVLCASSNTIFVRGRLAKTVGLFDESLGVGTPYLAGEDVDYALRAFAASRRSGYCDAALVGHRDKRPDLKALYYRGGMIVLRRHAADSLAHFVQYARKLAVGIALCLSGRLPLPEFLKSNFGALPPRARRGAP
jgi:hypothetical protein